MNIWGIQPSDMGQEHLDVTGWLSSLGLSDYASAFLENAIDAEVLPKLTAEDLKDLGVVQVGHRRKLLNAIAELQNATQKHEPLPDQEATGPEIRLSEIEPNAERQATSEAERRQLTVMFCDLTGSTDLATRLDPEDYREVIDAYQQTVAETVAPFSGFVAKYMGDGVLVYFGYPQAHEDDAERALRAGLALVENVAKLHLQHGLQVRIGVDTGVVVVGDLTGTGEAKERGIAGETPSLAARLQEAAPPNSILVSKRTRRLVGNLFQFTGLGEHQIKGFSEPVEVWQVLGASVAGSRFEALHASALTPLVGREEEIELLLRRWRDAKEGDGQTILIAGEPGIGKSRIVSTLIKRLDREPYIRLRYHCSPSYSNTAFYPVIEQLQRASGLNRNDPPEHQLAAVESLLKRGAADVRKTAPLIANLLSVPFRDRYSPIDVSSQRQKELTIAALLDQLEGLATNEPVLVIFEDVHWIDPSTKELLELMADRLPLLPVLLVATCRPEFIAPWGSAAHVTTLSLNRLGRRRGMELARKVAGGKDLPGEVLDQILAKTDGVPLFIEEFTKTVLESGLLEEEQDRYVLTGPLPQLAIPATLHDSLMARLDRLAQVKDVAQVGAAIGREFSYDLISACSRLADDDLQEALNELLNAELIFQRGSPPQATYTFKHALVQDAAYASLLRKKRQALHARIAGSLRQLYPEVQKNNPEVLAHHYTEAGLPEEAIEHWKLAGERALKSSAAKEASAHLEKALGLVRDLPAGKRRSEQELALQIALAPVLMLTEGFGSPRVRETYMRARELCREVGDASQLFKVTFGLWHVHQNRGDLESADALANEVLTLAREQGDPAFLLQAHHAAWTTRFHLADQVACHNHTSEGRKLYDVEAHRQHRFVFGGHDPGVCAHNHGAVTAWLLGYPEKAVSLSREAIALAEELDHAMSLVLAHCFASFLYQFRGEPELVLERAEATLAVCAEQGIAPHYTATGKIMRGWANAVLKEPGVGVEEIEEGLEELAATEMNARLPHYLSMLAEAEVQAGKVDRGLSALTRAEDVIERTRERRWQAEVYRLKGELLDLSGAPGDEVETCFRKALDVAAGQQAKSLELRAATSLARKWRNSGRATDAHKLLAPIYGWFSEGFETVDLRTANLLLNEIK